MTTKRYHKQGDIGRRLMWTLLAVVAIVVVGVLFFYGLRDPSEGPGNVPASGGAPAQQNGRPAAPK
jgi:hypothetical protein